MKGDKSDTGWNDRNPPEHHDYSPGPASAAAYIPPTQVPKESKYHTLDLKAVRLSPEIDPLRMKTQMALRRLPTVSHATAGPTMWVSLCLAGAALGLGAWWCLQWWREQGVVTSAAAGRAVIVQSLVAHDGVAQPSVSSIVLALPPEPQRGTKLQGPKAQMLSPVPVLVPTGSRASMPAKAATPPPAQPRPIPQGQ